MDQKHKGAYSELQACAWLLSKGYEVFRNVSAFGPVDLIVYKDGKEYKLDVKTTHPSYKTVGPKLKSHQLEIGVLPLYVDEYGCCKLPEEMHPTQS